MINKAVLDLDTYNSLKKDSEKLNILIRDRKLFFIEHSSNDFSSNVIGALITEDEAMNALAKSLQIENNRRMELESECKKLSGELQKCKVKKSLFKRIFKP